jgi:hypothetical protein
MTDRAIMTITNIVAAACAAIGLAISATPAAAHCDALNGPVVKAAQKALDTGELDHVLIWVQAKDEPEIHRAFDQTRIVRLQSEPARALADRYFFETVVRVHRAGEGAPFTGLQPAGRDLPAIAAADRALTQRDPAIAMRLLVDALAPQLRDHFNAAVGLQEWTPGDVAAGRRSVAAYVEYIHFVERLFEAMAAPAHGHFTDTVPPHR